MKNYSTTLLRICIIFIGLSVIGLCIGITVSMLEALRNNSPESMAAMALIIGMYLCVIPFFIGLYHTMKILKYIDNNNAFSKLSLKSLNYIKYLALSIFAVCTVGGLPFFYYWADKKDAPGLMIIGFVIAGCPFVFATLVAVLEKLLKDAIEVKKEMDLTV